jgi:hypothetical protein
MRSGCALSFVLVAWLVCAHAQQETNAPAAGVPVEREPRHHVVFEDAAVRVIDARLPVGDTTLYHTHVADNVPVVIRGGSMTVQRVGEAVQPASPRTGDASFARGGYTHQIVNIGSEPLQFLDVEVHAPVPTGAPDAAMPAEHDVVLDESRVRLLRFVNADSTHVHRRGLLAIVVPRGHDWTRGSPPGAPEPGTYWWVDADTAGRTVPAGTELVEIEIK